MKSTGEVMGISKNYEEAISKAFLSSGINIPSNGSVLLSIANRDKDKAKYLIKLIHEKGYNLIATPGTAKLIKELGFSAQVIEKSLDKNPNVIDKLRSSEVIAVVNTVSGDSKHYMTVSRLEESLVREKFHVLLHLILLKQYLKMR